MKQDKLHGHIVEDGEVTSYGVIGHVTPEPSVARKLREVLSDAYTFIRSAESNKALATVTLEELMGDQIKRNGASEDAKKTKYNPYSYDPEKDKPASQEPEKRVTFFVSGSDTGRPTKLDMLFAIKNELDDVVKEVKKMTPVEVAGRKVYQDASEVAAEEQ